MAALLMIGGILLIAVTLWDTFETIVLPRLVLRHLRPSRFLYRVSWKSASWVGRRIRSPRLRESWFSIYAPLSLLTLLAIWVSAIIIGFAMIHTAAQPASDFANSVYFSGTTFFTLGLGDEKPIGAGARFLTVVEAGLGFGMLAVVISYLPVLYQAFSRREVAISILSSRAGDPPTAGGLLQHYMKHREHREVLRFLRQYEQWAAELLENYISYPILALYRSQQDRQSWLAALTVILDASALLQLGLKDSPDWEEPVRDQAELTFAMGVKVVMILRATLGVDALVLYPDRLPEASFDLLQRRLRKVEMSIQEKPHVRERLRRLRDAYEPDIEALSRELCLPLPPFFTEERPAAGEPEDAVEQAQRLL